MPSLSTQFKKGTHLGQENSAWKGGQIKKTCIECGDGFLVYPHRKDAQFCSRKCGNKSPIRAQKIKENWYKVNRKFPSGKNHHRFGKHVSDDMKEKIRKKLTGRKMSMEVRLKKVGKYAGSKHHNWKGGATKLAEKIRNSFEYTLWREAVFARDNWTCVWCGVRGSKLNADHIKPFALYPELRFAIDNGRTLCVPCHKTTDTYLVNNNKIAREAKPEIV